MGWYKLSADPRGEKALIFFKRAQREEEKRRDEALKGADMPRLKDAVLAQHGTLERCRSPHYDAQAFLKRRAQTIKQKNTIDMTKWNSLQKTKKWIKFIITTKPVAFQN